MAFRLRFHFLLLQHIFVFPHLSHGGHQPFSYQNFECMQDFRMTPEPEQITGKESFILKTLQVKERNQCALECVKHGACLSYNVQKKESSTSGRRKCELLKIRKTSTKESNLQKNNEYSYFTSQVSIEEVSLIFTADFQG